MCGKFETLESVVQAVQAFVQQHALANDMPVARVFGRAGETHLMNSICRHGIKKVAEAAGLRYSCSVGPQCSCLRRFSVSCATRCKVSLHP